MRQLVELSNALDEVRAHGAEVVAIAQEETHPADLARTRRFVGDGIRLLADPDHLTWKTLPRYRVFVVDPDRVVRVAVRGTRLARPRLDLVLAALGERRPPPKVEVEIPRSRAALPAARDVVSVRWLFSHDALRPSSRIRLALVVLVAPGWHVYGFGERSMTPFSVELELPDGIERRDPIEYPRPEHEHDPVLDRELAVYREAIPLSAITLHGAPDLRPGRVTLRIKVRFQACNEETCLPPVEQLVELPLEVVAADAERRQIAGWQRW